MCAEGTAIYNHSINYPDDFIEKVVVVAKNLSKKLVDPISPCGACRQVLLEYELKQQKEIYIL